MSFTLRAICVVLWLGLAHASYAQQPVTTAAELAPIPSDADQAALVATIRDLYKSDFAAAKQPLQKSTLARRLLDQAIATKNDNSGQYVLLKESVLLATTAGDPFTALAAVDEMERRFQMDALDVRTKLLSALFRDTKSKPALGYLADQATQWSALQMKQGNFEAANITAKTALLVARKAADVNLVRMTGDLAKQTQHTVDKQAEVLAAQQTLETSPADPGATGTLGLYLCTCRDDWTQGLTHLALCGIADVQAISAKELESNFQPILETGSIWWNIALARDDEFEKRAFQRRAVWHLEASLAKVEGLARKKYEKYILEYRSAYPEQFWRDEQLVAQDPAKAWSQVGADKTWHDVYLGQNNVWRSHPTSPEVPFVWMRQVCLPEKTACALTMQVATNGADVADFQLQVRVNNKVVFEKIINGKAWQPIVVDLAPFAGSDAKIEIVNANGGGTHWNHEHLYIAKLRIVPR